jgi:predicted nucleic acid-binding protein
VGLNTALGAGPVALDTAAFIYFIEEHESYLPLLAPLFRDADRGRRVLVTSALTLLEVLVVPYRAGNAALAERYEALLTRGRGLRLVDLDHAQLRAAAQLRAVTRMRTPDALQLAAALTQRCTAFVTNDREYPVVPGLRVVQLRDFAAG